MRNFKRSRQCEKLIEIISEKPRTYDELASILYPNAPSKIGGRVNVACILKTLHKRGVPIYLTERGGVIDFIENEVDFRKVNDRTSTLREGHIKNHFYFLSSAYENMPMLRDEIKLSALRLVRMVLDKEEDLVRLKNGNQTNENRAIKTRQEPTKKVS